MAPDVQVPADKLSWVGSHMSSLSNLNFDDWVGFGGLSEPPAVDFKVRRAFSMTLQVGSIHDAKCVATEKFD